MPWADQQMTQGQNMMPWNPPYHSFPLERQNTPMQTAQQGQTQRLGMILPTLQGLFGQGGSGAAGGMGGAGSMPNVQTSINPSGVFNQNQTQQSINQTRALAQQHADPRSAMKQFDRPGVSRSAGTMQAAMPQIVQGRAQAAMAPATIGLQDAQTNAQQLLQGQTARENEGLSLAGLLGQQQQIGINERNQMLNPLLQYLQGIIG